MHHLWKQFRRHGKAGGAEEAAAAAEQGGQEKRPAAPGRLELKPGAGQVYAGPAGTEPALNNMPFQRTLTRDANHYSSKKYPLHVINAHPSLRVPLEMLPSSAQ